MLQVGSFYTLQLWLKFLQHAVNVTIPIPGPLSDQLAQYAKEDDLVPVHVSCTKK